ncbi:hypothetical protein KR093_001819 [Drosophila rubida]|uniref:Uncharacterized protein n=1 Tax=Drosophila rubida TaxID=30044 RepID=A0AAD4K4H5_9MUSC|nr:hypothetical protein KR093_001819 [Drosophila rubida]
MVYTERTDKCLSTSKDNAATSKSPSTSATSSSSSASSSSSKTSWSSQASSGDKWKYNNMVKDNRDKFNSMHFS